MKKSEVELLKQFKSTSGWSDDRISKGIGVHGQTIQAWLTGKKVPGNLSRQAIRGFLNQKAAGRQLDKEKAELAVKVMEVLGLPHGFVGSIRSHEGSWWLGNEARATLLGAAFGLAYGLKTKSSADVANTLGNLLVALGMTDDSEEDRKTFGDLTRGLVAKRKGKR